MVKPSCVRPGARRRPYGLCFGREDFRTQLTSTADYMPRARAREDKQQIKSENTIGNTVIFNGGELCPTIRHLGSGIIRSKARQIVA